MRDKRVKYDTGLYVEDRALLHEINNKAREFVIGILDGIGKDYLIPDLEPLIISAVTAEILDKELVEYDGFTEE